MDVRTDSLPYIFVYVLTECGIDTDHGAVRLRQYLCSSLNNGGNANAKSLIGPLRFTRNSSGQSMNSLVGGRNVDLALKGQGSPAGFAGIWNFMLANEAAVGRIRISCGPRADQTGDTRTGTVESLYHLFDDPVGALERMVADRFFGIDCIGFVANYLIWLGVWTEYRAYGIDRWPQVFPVNVRRAADVRPVQLMLWGGHVALVDWVHSVNGDQVVIDMCQSSSGGPQCNERVLLTAIGGAGSSPRRFTVRGGTPPAPVQGTCTIWRRDDLTYVAGAGAQPSQAEPTQQSQWS